jgi:tRNA modification GTPase
MMTRRLPIIAVATAPGKAGVGVIRISGPQLRPIAEALFKRLLPLARQTYSRFEMGGVKLLTNSLRFIFLPPPLLLARMYWSCNAMADPNSLSW